jgi:ribose transport system permease protein
VLRKIDKSLLMSVVILVLVLVVFQITTKGNLLTKRNLLNIINQSLTTAIAGLGLIFVAAMGGTNITAGVVAATAGVIAVTVARTAFALTFPAAMAVGLLFGLFLGFVNAVFKVPSFMASLAILIAGRAAFVWYVSSRVIFAPMDILALNKLEYKIPILALLTILIGYILEYTPFGNYVKAIGENENAVKFMGINVRRYKIWAYALSGIMFGIAGIFLIARSGGASHTMGTGMEMQVMMALFIGGVPVQGGTGTRIFKLLFGAPLIVLLENGLVLSGTSGPMTQLVKGLALLAIVYLSVRLNKVERLREPKEQLASSPGLS